MVQLFPARFPPLDTWRRWARLSRVRWLKPGRPGGEAYMYWCEAPPVRRTVFIHRLSLLPTFAAIAVGS